MKMSAPVGDGLDVGSSHAQKPVRQIRQGAGDCEFLTYLRYVLISRVATRCSMAGQIGAAAYGQTSVGFCAVIARRNGQHDRPVSYRVHGYDLSSPEPATCHQHFPQDRADKRDMPYSRRRGAVASPV